jgi:signal recognition particle subunit SRP68
MTLMQAERSWAYAMELREQQASSRTKFHAMSRLKKSVKWSKILLNLTEQTADPRTKLEAQAYANWMSGNLLREHEQWKDSVEQLVKARTIYQQLSKVASADQSELYNHRCEEIETIIKFCQYNLGGASDADIRKIVFEDPVLKQQLDVRTTEFASPERRGARVDFFVQL